MKAVDEGRGGVGERERLRKKRDEGRSERGRGRAE